MLDVSGIIQVGLVQLMIISLQYIYRPRSLLYAGELLTG